MDILQLYDYAERRNITVKDYVVHGKKGTALKIFDEYHILLNETEIETEREKREVFAHELGHCETDLFYYLDDINNPLFRQNLEKIERIAQDKACTYLVDVNTLKEAVKTYKVDYLIAEELDLSVDTLNDVIKYYTRKGYKGLNL